VILAGGCLYRPTDRERAASFAPYAGARIGGDSARDFILARSGILLEGPDLAFEPSVKNPQ